MSESPVSKSHGKLGRHQWQDPEVFIVCGLGSGFAPKAPGTFGSLAAILIWFFVLGHLSLPIQLLVMFWLPRWAPGSSSASRTAIGSAIRA